jgi:hypothetical protein
MTYTIAQIERAFKTAIPNQIDTCVRPPEQKLTGNVTGAWVAVRRELEKMREQECVCRHPHRSDGSCTVCQSCIFTPREPQGDVIERMLRAFNDNWSKHTWEERMAAAAKVLADEALVLVAEYLDTQCGYSTSGQEHACNWIRARLLTESMPDAAVELAQMMMDAGHSATSIVAAIRAADVAAADKAGGRA